MIRNMGDYCVSQRTKDGMFNATGLAKQWNDLHNGSRKDISNFFENKSTKEFINALQSENDNTGIPVFTKNRGKNGGTWMNPLLFIDFAMWLNPTFKVQVLKFVYDELIKNRHYAGDNYKVLSSAGCKLSGYNFKKVAKAMQWIVFNKTGKELRQTANQNQLREISDLETKLAFAIDMDYIKTFDDLMKEFRKMYAIKYLSNPIKL